VDLHLLALGGGVAAADDLIDVLEAAAGGHFVSHVRAPSVPAVPEFLVFWMRSA
jgi:hypothetical protein